MKKKIYLVVAIMILIFIWNDSFLYSDTIGKITGIETTSNRQGEVDFYEQTMTVTVLNGIYKGKTLEVKNTYSQSLTVDEKYEKGNRIFLNISENTGEVTATIKGLKRDIYVVAAILLFVFAVLCAGKKKGIYALISVAINIALLYVALILYAKNTHILAVTIFLMIIFSILSLLFAGGRTRATYAAIVSTLITVTLVGLLYVLIIKIMGEPEYFMMEYTEYLNNTDYFNLLFLAEVLVGGLGAIMDVTISIATTLEELMRIDPDIAIESLYDGARQVAYDIMGTMVNVLFLSYFCGTIPLILIKLVNQYGFMEIYKFHIPFEVIRFLTGSIGIILSIPISIGICISFLKGRGNER